MDPDTSNNKTNIFVIFSGLILICLKYLPKSFFSDQVSIDVFFGTFFVTGLLIFQIYELKSQPKKFRHLVFSVLIFLSLLVLSCLKLAKITPLHLEFIQTKPWLLKFFLKLPCNVNTEHFILGSPLLVAIRSETGAEKLLIEAGAQVNCQGDYGNTPLTLAISQRKKDLVIFLIKSGADVNFHDVFYSPLMRAVDSDIQTGWEKGPTINSFEMLELLLSYGADPELSSEKSGNLYSHVRYTYPDLFNDIFAICKKKE